MKEQKVSHTPGSAVSDRVKETVGRKFDTVRFGVHSRRVEDGDGCWFGFNTYKTFDEAVEKLRSMGRRFQDIGGGLTLDTGEPTDLFEYRIVKVVSQLEVVHTEFRKI